MRKGFTLIELLVVLVIISLVLGLTVPKGLKMLHGFQQAINKIKKNHKLSQICSYAFIKGESMDMKISNTHYHITSKGIIIKNEKIYDNY